MTFKSATVGSEFFLQSDFLSIGINAAGGLGTRAAAPVNFATDTVNSYTRVGMYADLDGFGKGKAPTLGDVLLQASPIEGFSIGYGFGGKTVTATNWGSYAIQQIAGTGKNLSTADQGKAGWEGQTKEKLAVDQTITLSDDASYIRVEVKLTNESNATMSDLRYMRTIDPDQGRNAFKTENKIVDQGSGKALVAAYATGGTNPFFFYSDDDRARGSIWGFNERDPYTAAAWDKAQAEGYAKTADESLHLTFNVGDLKAGQSTTLVFYMGVASDLAKTIRSIDAGETSDPTTPPPVDTNDAPDAVADSASVEAGKSVSGNVLKNDKDADGDSLTASLVSGPKNGTLKLNADGSYTYTAKDGFSGTDTFTYKASDGKLSDTATVSIAVTKGNQGPTAVADSASVEAGETVKGNVLTNDKDPDGDALTASLVSGPKNGTLKLNADGSYSYTAKDGFAGTDTFTYKASDGKATSTATVTVKVTAPEPAPEPVPGDSPILSRAGTVDGSNLLNQVLIGSDKANTFYFETSGVTGVDRISNFGKNDVLVTDKSIVDSNGDGIISFSKNTVTLDGLLVKDIVKVEGVSSLRYLGEEDGLHVYANGAVRPKGAIEGKLGDSALSGDKGDAKEDIFFVDSALGLDLGNDVISNFGSKDLLVTTESLSGTSAKASVGFGSNELLDFDSGSTLGISSAKGGLVTSLEFDGTVTKNGVTYYVYSLEGSGADAGDLFG